MQCVTQANPLHFTVRPRTLWQPTRT